MRFISKRNLYRKYLVISAIFLLLGSGLYIFDSNQEFLDSFQIYYLKSYRLALNYNLLNTKNVLASFLSSVVYSNNSVKNTAVGNAESIPVLLYHGIIDKPDGANVLLEDFKDQMFALKKAGWQTVGIEDFYAFMKGGKELSDKSFLLTFDDGRKDSYYPVDPILKAVDYRAVMFAISGRSIMEHPSPFHLSFSELKRMYKSGRWDLQSHGRDDHDFYKIDADGNEGHFLSNKLWLDDKQRIETGEEFRTRIYSDLVNSKNDLEKKFTTKVIGFAYPFGDFGQNSINFPEAENIVLDTIKSVYPMSFYQVWGGNPKANYPQPDSEHLFMKRINVAPQWGADDLLAVLENSREKNISYEDDFIKDSGWIKDWGRMDFKDDSIVIGANALTTGSAVFLGGTSLWQDYVFKADVYPTRGQVFSLMARYKDGKNYAACSFSNESIRVEQVINGEKKILSELKGDFIIVRKDHEAGIGVIDNAVNCYLDGEIITSSYNLDQNLNHGGIGFKTWDSQMNNSELIVKKVSVEEITENKKNEFTRLAEIELLQKNKAVSSALSSNKPRAETKIKTDDVFISSINLTDGFGSSTPYFVNNFSNINNLKKIWGNYSIENDFLSLNASTTSSVFVVLNGTLDWKDYLFRVKSDWGNNAGFSLVARYKDSKNYAYCSFSHYGKYASLYTVINGKTEKFGNTGELAIPYFQAYLNTDFSIQAKDDEIRCFVGDQWVLRENFSELPKSGGIGVKNWSTGSNDSKILIKEFSAKIVK
ncbi:MAG: polysaccharide deacetylase family protein [bacterium]|nr:polysaccharide deacetylase family protein [bacterium]